jgi:predicted dehydrogenase
MTQLPLKVVLAGCGQMAKTWLKTAVDHPDLQIVGLVDVHLPSAEKARIEFAPEAETGTDLAAVIKDSRGDVLFNCTTPAAHHPLSLLALEKGLHVVSEKPLANSMDEARDLLKAAAKAKKHYVVTQNYRYGKGIRNLKAYLKSGLIGEVTGLYCDFFIGAHFGGFREEMDHVVLLDMSIHHFDMARFLCGKNPATVTCVEWNPPGSWYQHGANANAHFAFEDSVSFNYRASWCAEGFNTPWNGLWRIIGTKGSLTWDGANEIRCDQVVQRSGFQSKTQERLLPLNDHPGLENGHASAISQFVQAVRKEQPAETDITDNIHSLGMVFGAIESAREGRRLALTVD